MKNYKEIFVGPHVTMLLSKIKAKFPQKAKIFYASLAMSVFTLVVYHVPFFRHVVGHIDADFSGIWIFISLVLVMLAVNFFVYYLLLYLGRIVGKCLLAFFFIGNSLALYFINNYNVLITDKMMGNVFNTRYSEASAFFSWTLFPYLIFLGILPCIYIFWRKFDFGSVKRFFATIGTSLAIIIAIILSNFSNVLWIDQNATYLGSLLMPWSYTVNTFRYIDYLNKQNQKEIRLPDATITSDSRDVCVLVIGESARSANFSLYGYERKTNPLLEHDGVRVLNASANATCTIDGVKAILSHSSSGKLYEILPNYLDRTGVDVQWRTSNWGEPPVHIEKYYKVADLSNRESDFRKDYDEVLLSGMKEDILACDSLKMLIIIHSSTSHGPTYFKKYPKEFEQFTPVCTSVEMSKANRSELVNAYDNTILYTDYFLHSIIEILREIPERRSTMIYVSDHGESLGENNLYMHGVPMMAAPKEQIQIPFIVWTSEDDADDFRVDSRKIDQRWAFHSVLGFFGVESQAYNPEKDLFKNLE